MRLVVLAYHDVGYVCLKHLLNAGEQVIAVITHNDNPSENIWWRSVARLAESRGVPVFAPDDMNTTEWIARIREWQPEIIFSFYFRKMVSNAILDIPSRGCLNLHGSLLPKYAGRVPVNWVLVNGETETGVTLHYMVEKPDAGDIVAQQVVPIEFTDTAKMLFDKVTVAAEALLRKTWPPLKAGLAPRAPQELSHRSYFGGRKPADGLIDWSWPAARIYNLVRAVTRPYPGAFTFLDGRKLLVWEAWPLDERSAAPLGTIVRQGSEVAVANGAGLLLIRRAQFHGGNDLAGEELAVALPVGQKLESK